ncbi:uncharacterized protein LOC108665855 [Hyalella azteca]|uniref:Uncharacterized protein LOC108665855 n=1 Tax=Hyalella azteca TaxID=294128 RepID=A0A979FEW2_HYAAZ|nr:uncharacterized protein LOC108665855 [Hyalella azteca]
MANFGKAADVLQMSPTSKALAHACAEDSSTQPLREAAHSSTSCTLQHQLHTPAPAAHSSHQLHTPATSCILQHQQHTPAPAAHSSHQLHIPATSCTLQPPAAHSSHQLHTPATSCILQPPAAHSSHQPKTSPRTLSLKSSSRIRVYSTSSPPSRVAAVLALLAFGSLAQAGGGRQIFGDPGDLNDLGHAIDVYLSEQNIDASEVAHRRAKRYLSFPPSSTAKVKTQITVPLFDEYDSYVKATFKGFATWSYSLPTNFVTLGRSLSDARVADRDTSRARRACSVAEGRTRAYAAIENAFESVGLPGEGCMLRAVCQAAAEGLPEGYGLLGEITAMLLAPLHDLDNTTSAVLGSYTAAERRGHDTGDCDTVYSDCPVHLTDLVHSAVTVLHGQYYRGKLLF